MSRTAFAALAAAALGLVPTLVCADMPAETRRSVPSVAACDRACLYGFADRYMAALIAKDPTRLPLAKGARFSENMVMMPLGEGAWNTADAIGPHFEFADIPHGQVAEGAKSCRSVLELANRHGIDVPITQAVEAVCYRGLAPAQMVEAMMTRAMKSE